MVKATLTGIGKRFQTGWAVKGLDITLEAGQAYVVTGNNGSGKSTLIKIIAGYLTPTQGTIRWHHHGKAIAEDKIYQMLSMAAPYLEPPDDLSFPELISFHQSFRPFVNGISKQEVLDRSELPNHPYKPLKHYSTGMRQRVKLSLAILSNTPLLLLDEPCTNLDKASKNWYASLLKEFRHNRTMAIASNHNTEEYPSEHGVIALDS